jgi:hypothetical protein
MILEAPKVRRTLDLVGRGRSAAKVRTVDLMEFSFVSDGMCSDENHARTERPEEGAAQRCHQHQEQRDALHGR